MKLTVTSLGLYLMRRRARQTLRWCVSNDVLEIGVGRGVFARYCLDRGIRYSVVDSSIDALRALPPEVRGIWQIAPPVWPTPERRFGAIVAEAVLEHMPDYLTAVQFVRSAHLHLQSGGRLVLRFPEIRFSRFAFWEFPPDHQYVTSLPRVCTLLEQNGFEVERSGYFVDCFYGPAAHVVWWLTRVIPTRILGTVAFWGGGRRKNLWFKLGEKAPQAYIVARRVE